MLRCKELLRFVPHLRVAEHSCDAHKSTASAANIRAGLCLKLLAMSLQPFPRGWLRSFAIEQRPDQVQVLIPHRRAQRKLKGALRQRRIVKRRQRVEI